MKTALLEHWPEYLIGGWALGRFMIAIGLLVTIFESPTSAAYAAIPNTGVRAALLASGIGISLTVLIQSPWGKRSGAHMNPAITLAFLRLRRIHAWDALFYILAQIIGGTFGVLLVAAMVGKPFIEPPVPYAVTIPGSAGRTVAFLAATAVSFVLMATILAFTTSGRLIRFTAWAAGSLVAFLIMVEAPVSGTSMNPARTLASAVPATTWQHLWIYLLGPTLGMLAAAELHSYARGQNAIGCAKLLHPPDIRCVHCGYRPDAAKGAFAEIAGSGCPNSRC